MNLLDRIGNAAARFVMSRAGVARPGWPEWQKGLELFFLPDEALRHMDAFAKVPDVYFCVSLISEYVSRLPILFYEGEGERRVKLDPDDPRSPHQRWKKANPRQTGPEVMRDLVGHLLLGGNGYLMMEFGNLTSDPLSIISAMYALESQFTTPLLGDGHTVAAYRYLAYGLKPLDIPENQVVHVPDFNTEDVGRGLTRMDALRLSYETERDAERFQRQLMKRGGIPAPWFTSEVALTQPLMKQLHLDVDSQTTIENAGKAVFLPKGLKPERAQLTNAEMQFVEAGGLTLARLLRAFKVPPILAGIKVGGLGGSDKGADADMLLFVDHAIRPLTTFLQLKFNEVLLRPQLWRNRSLSCEFDFSNVPAIQNLWLAQAAQYVTVTRKVLTVNEARAKLGLEKYDDPEADKLDVAPPPVVVPGSDGPGQKKPPSEPATSQKKALADDALNEAAMSVVLRDLMRARARASQERHIERFRSFADARFQRQRKAMKRALREAMGEEKARLFSLETLLATLDDPAEKAKVRRLIEAIARDAAAEVLAALALEITYDLASADAAQWMREQTLSFITNTNATTRAALRESLSEGLAAQETSLQLTRRIDEVFANRRGNAQTIAITEGNTARNAAQRGAMQQAADQLYVTITKEWLTAQDENVRGNPSGPYADAEFSHFEADGLTVALEQPFLVGEHVQGQGEPCDFPGDPGLSAGNRINCRCTAVYHVLDDAKRHREVPLEELFRR